MTAKPSIHQFHSGTAKGDAVTNSLFYTRTLLRRLGFESEIYAEHIAPELKDSIRPYLTYEPDSGNVLLVHHSMGHDILPWIASLPDTKVLVYHNVTPVHFFPEGSYIAQYARKGIDMLRELLPMMKSVVADSEENADGLREAGCPNPVVLPLLLDQVAISEGRWNDALVQRESRVPVVLFVGRTVNNKCQHDLIRLASVLRRYHPNPFKVVLVGSFNHDDEYCRFVAGEVKRLELEDIVTIAGKVSDEDLRAWYRASSVYVSMSEHEGFGVPFVEAMLFDLPIVAYRSSAIPHVLGESGLIFDDKDFERVAALVSEVMSNRSLRRAIITGQRRRVRAFSESEIIRGLVAVLEGIGVSACAGDALREPAAPPFITPQWQIEGPFETSYSLALVNRHLALALESRNPGKVGLWATEGPGDYVPKVRDLLNHPAAAAMHARTRKASQADVVVRNLWPPRLRDMDGLINLPYFFWEESVVPREIVEEINASADGVLAPTEFCRRVYADNGIKVPMRVIGAGWDHIAGYKPSGVFSKLPGGFRFLHISSAFPRKGVDVLLRAFEAAFPQEGDTVLILKTFPNPHNKVGEALKELESRNPAVFRRIVWIDRDLSTEDILDLYENCDAFVAPTRGEGFGLPMLEAMALGVPVISTRAGGHADFCDETTSWPVDCEEVPSQSHLSAGCSFWFEPDLGGLVARLREVRGAPADELALKTSAASRLVREKFSWDACAARAELFRDELRACPVIPKRPRVAFVTTWNSKCGIAAYAERLAEGLLDADADVRVFADTGSQPHSPDDKIVSRVWTQGHLRENSLAELEHAITGAECDSVVIQFNFGFFNVHRLAEMIRSLRNRGIKVLICLHSTKDVERPDLRISLGEIVAELALCHRVLVHAPSDKARLSAWGLKSNVVLFPHGMLNRRPLPLAEARKRAGLEPDGPWLATFGYCLPHKGLVESIEAFAIFRKKNPGARLLMLNALYPAPPSYETAEACRLAIERLGLKEHVVVRHDFIPDAECMELLNAVDLTVLAYGPTNESSSAAVRMALASGAPALCTPVSIFDDVAGAVHLTSGHDPACIAESIQRVLSDEAERRRVAEGRSAHLYFASWKACGDRLLAMIAH